MNKIQQKKKEKEKNICESCCQISLVISIMKCIRKFGEQLWRI